MTDYPAEASTWPPAKRAAYNRAYGFAAMLKRPRTVPPVTRETCHNESMGVLARYDVEHARARKLGATEPEADRAATNATHPIQIGMDAAESKRASRDGLDGVALRMIDR